MVAPAGPAAELPVELAQTCAGVGVMVGVTGSGLIVTGVEPETMHPFGAVTARVGDPATIYFNVITQLRL